MWQRRLARIQRLGTGLAMYHWPGRVLLCLDLCRTVPPRLHHRQARAACGPTPGRGHATCLCWLPRLSAATPAGAQAHLCAHPQSTSPRACGAGRPVTCPAPVRRTLRVVWGSSAEPLVATGEAPQTPSCSVAGAAGRSPRHTRHWQTMERMPRRANLDAATALFPRYAGPLYDLL